MSKGAVDFSLLASHFLLLTSYFSLSTQHSTLSTLLSKGEGDMNAEQLRWWQTGVIYQIYPRSFQDSSGNGVGDLAGVIQRLDYLAELGVSALWLSPIYPSPMKDHGYDVADYCDIDPLFGDLATFDRLLEEAHGRGLKLIIDLVPNHTSDQHPWFLESRQSRDNPKRDWYIWRDPKPDGSPPNNWGSFLAAPHGHGTKPPGSITCTNSSKNSPNSTGATPNSSKRCWMLCAFG
jgi:hypothetical protein